MAEDEGGPDETSPLPAPDQSQWQSALDLIGDSARNSPDRIAVTDGHAEHSYRDLWLDAQHLAHALRERGLGHGDLVALDFERGPGFVAAALGVWWSGAAYLPLAPNHPAAWREQVVHAAGAAIVVGAAGVSGVPHMPVDGRARTNPGDLNPATLMPDDLAYVISTSGSSGEPKLVMIEHRGVANLIHAQRAFLGDIGVNARVLQFFHPSFDAAMFDVLLALPNGARLETIHTSQTSGDGLAEVLRRRRITHAVLPAAVLRMLTPGGFPDLKVVMSIGDVCQPETARRWAARHRFINGYGPTEVSICSTLYDADGTDEALVPIGRPISGLMAVVVDDDLRPVPSGDVGEICFGGAGVGRGYLGRDGLTAERFVVEPASGVRLYRTGDLGRQWPDGTLEFIGRADDQVKIRGARVELGQVERALAEMPDVVDAVASVDNGPADGAPRLLAYVLLKPGTSVAMSSLRRSLANRLPTYLVPDFIVSVDSWPLTTNGKVDRIRLPRPQRSEDADFVSPLSPAEKTIADIAALLIGVDRVGRNDNLMTLGANSLVLTQLVGRVREELGVQVALSRVLAEPTVEAVARHLDHPGAEAKLRSGAAPSPSYAQRRVWLMHLLEPESRAYHSQAVLRLSGELDVDALEATLTTIVRRHDVLRSRFPVVDGELYCEIAAPWRVILPVQDLSNEGPEAISGRITEEVRAAVEITFDLAAGPPVRWQLLRLSDREHLFIQVEHHIVHDGWSFMVFLRDLLDGYAEQVHEGRISRPVPQIQYYDYVQWQHEWCRSRAGQHALQFWRSELEDAETVLMLPRRGGTDTPQFRGRAARIEISEELARAVQALAEQTGSSLYVTLLTVFFALLHRVTGSRDILVGSGVANRRFQETEQLLGMFVNTVVMRSRLDQDPTFLELLAQVHQTALAVYDHQELPFDLIFSQSGALPGSGVRPLVQTMFSFHDAPVLPLRATPLDVTVVEGLSNGSARFELSVVAVPRYEESGRISRLPGDVLHYPHSSSPVAASKRSALRGITLAWEFDTNVFDELLMRSLMAGYEELLRAAVATPAARMSSLSIVDEPTRHALSRVGHGGSRTPPTNWVPALVDHWIRRTPDAPAVIADSSLSYAELGRRSGQLAARLRDAGVERGDVVAVCLRPSPDAVIAQLGVLLAEAAFLPLDASHPSNRLAWLIRDSGARAVITSARMVDRLPDTPRPLVVDESPDDAHLPQAAYCGTGNGDDLAYVIYTSGTSGSPKGVEITHRALASRLYQIDAIAWAPGDRMLAVTSPAFDLSIMEVWGPLMHGAAVRFLSWPWDIPALARAFATQSVRHSVLSTGVFHRLVDQHPEALADVNRVLVVGDVLAPEAFRAVRAVAGRGVSNAYGPTEATVIATHQPVETWDDLPESSVSIGRPTTNTSVLILDDRLQLVPPGVVGEICLGGAGIARGYRNAPDLTARRFVEDPNEPGRRLYRTGDLGCWRMDGSIEFLGRRDDQIKVRGFRVSLEEVRTALLAIPAVRDAAVTAIPDADGGRRLVAYVVSTQDSTYIRAAVAETEPDFMVPSVVIALDALPLTTSGKTDYDRLPAPPTQMDGAIIAPRGAVEATLAEIVAELLGLASVSVTANLFTLGLHSLQAMRLVARASAALDREVLLRQVFAWPTVAGLAAAVAHGAQTAPPIAPVARRTT